MRIRLQPDFLEEVPASAYQMAHDTVSESALGPTEYDSRFLAMSLPDRTSDDNTLSTFYDVVYGSRRNRRNAQAADHEDSRTRFTSVFHA